MSQSPSGLASTCYSILYLSLMGYSRPWNYPVWWHCLCVRVTACIIRRHNTLNY